MQGSHSRLLFSKDEPNPLCAPLFPSRALDGAIPFLFPPLQRASAKGKKKIHKNTQNSISKRFIPACARVGGIEELLQVRRDFFSPQLTSLQNPSRPQKTREKPPPSRTNLTEPREKKFKSELPLEGRRTSPGLKLSFPAPFPGAASHPWTTPTHPA